MLCCPLSSFARNGMRPAKPPQQLAARAPLMHKSGSVVDLGETDYLVDLGETDYLVVGAGAASMAFVDTLLLEQPHLKIMMIDKNDIPGGHVSAATTCVRHM